MTDPIEKVTGTSTLASASNRWARVALRTVLPTDRTDVISIVQGAPAGIPQGTPAWFIRDKRELTIDLAVAIPDVEERRTFCSLATVALEGTWRAIKSDASHLSITEAQKLAQHGRIIRGMITHEASHAAWSVWTPQHLPEDISDRVRAIVMMMEEIRVEKRAVDRLHSPELLRYTFGWLVKSMLGRGELPGDPLGLSHMWGLTVGRYKSGIAGKDEIEKLDLMIRGVIGDDVVDILNDILDEAVALEIRRKYVGTRDTYPQLSRLVELATEWIETLGESTDDPAPTLVMACGGTHDEKDAESGDDADDAESGDESEGESGKDSGTGTAAVKSMGAESGDGDGEDEGEGEGEDNSDKSTGEKTEAEYASHGQSDDVASSVPSGDIELIKAALEAIEGYMEDGSRRKDEPPMADPREMAQKIFGPKPKNYRHRWSERDPEPALRFEATRLARTLETLSLPSVTKLRRPSTVPPGRLRGREMVRRGAEQSIGLMSTATPWERTKRERTRTKPVVVGCMTDVSGSMSWAEEIVAEFAWVVAKAGIHVGARTAAVTFGAIVEAVTRPGEVPNKVKVRKAADGEENFDKALAALDGVLRFSVNNNAAKVLFVFSDAALVRSREPERAQKWVRELTAVGTTIVWIGAERHYMNALADQVRSPGSLSFLDVPTAMGGWYGVTSPEDKKKLYTELSKVIVKAAQSQSFE